MNYNFNHSLGIDIGGTGIKMGIVDVNTGRLKTKRIKINTPKPSVPKAIIKLIGQQILKHNWQGNIGCGFPGVIKNGIIQFVGNLHKSWIGINLERELRSYTTARVRTVNDADAAALAEMKFGAGKKFNNPNGGIVLVLTFGTGIGSSIFLNGQLLPNTEFGHLELDGNIAEKKAATVIREKENLTWKKWGKRVNRYVKHIDKIVSPDIIIIGGGISAAPEKFFPYLDVKTKFVAAKLRDDAGIVGAAYSVNLTI